MNRVSECNVQLLVVLPNAVDRCLGFGYRVNLLILQKTQSYRGRLLGWMRRYS